jgi:hypothetical protein
MRVRLFDQIRDLPEHADHVLAAENRHGADLDGQAATVLVHDRDPGVRDPLSADHLSNEQLARAPRVLGGDNGRELTAAHVSDDPLRSRVQPRTTPVVSMT